MLVNIALISANYLIIYPLIFLLGYKSALQSSNINSNQSRLLSYILIYVLVIVIYVCIPPGYMTAKNVLTASHRILGLVVVYEPFSYFCFALMLYMVTRINSRCDYLMLGMLIGFSLMVTERSILWMFPIASYYLLILIRKKLLSIKTLVLIFVGVVLVISWYFLYNFLFYDNVFNNSRGSNWLNRCLHWASRLDSLYPGLSSSSQCPPRISLEYISYNFIRLMNDYSLSLFFIFGLIAPLALRTTRLLVASLVLVSLLNVIVTLAYINPQTFIKYNSILIWPIIFSVAIVVFQFDGFRGLKKVIR